MARVFVEKALNVTGLGQFELIQMASKRARELSAGAKPMVVPKNESNGAIALQEIEEGKYTLEHFEGTAKTDFQLEQEELLNKELNDEFESTQS